VAEPSGVLRREMGFTRAEFMRILPSALHGYAYRVHDDSILVEVSGSRVTIRLGQERIRQIALLRLPCLDVEFDHAEVDEPAFRQFLRQFDLYYRKGGG
jgi:hypothetical protein